MPQANQIDYEFRFIKYHDRLRSELNNVSEHLEIATGIISIPHDCIPALNLAPTFFMMTLDAHRYSILMGLSRLTDQDHRNQRATVANPTHLSMLTFLAFIRDNLSLFSEEQFKARLEQLDRLDELALGSRSEISTKTVDDHIQIIRDLPIPNVRHWRNTALAHIQAAAVLKDIKVSALYPVKMAQIEKAVDTIDNILNFYYLNFNSTTWMRSRLSQGQPQRIADALDFYHKNRNR